jgi:plastocyanin
VPTVGGKRTGRVAGGLLGVVMVLGLAGCGGSSSTSLNQTADITIQKVDGLPRFDPDKIQVPLNQDETFTVLNKDKILHNVTIPAFAVDMDIQPGQRISVKIPPVTAAPRDGFFTFYDKYHQAEGAAGKITVSK